MNKEKAAENLFVRLSDYINQKAIFENGWTDAQGKTISLIRLSTDEKWTENKPWKGIFYLHFYYGEKETPVPVGIGSFTRSQIVVDENIVSPKICALLDKFSFGIVAVNSSFERIKEEILPHYQEIEKTPKTTKATPINIQDTGKIEEIREVLDIL